MTYIIGVVSQKGGVGKSTIARLLGREVAAGGLRVMIADLDTLQGTSEHWAKRRNEAGILPAIPVKTFPNVKSALAEAPNYDVFIIDGAPHASVETRTAARAADLVVIPTGQTVDDLYPSVMLAHDLVKEGISKNKIAMALCRLTDSSVEARAARIYLSVKAKYHVLKGGIAWRTAYAKASDEGKALSETAFPSLNKRAEELAQSIVDAAAAVSSGEGRAVA
jgi:chromosome partitioning protein